MFVWINGQVLPAEEAAVSPVGRGWMLGEGVFETLVWRDGRAEALTSHWKRLKRGTEVMGLPVPALDEMKAALEAVVEANPGRHRLRYTVSRSVEGCDVCAVATMLTVWPEEEAVMVVPFRRNERGALAGIKATSYAENLLALRHAQDQGCGEALLLNTRGELCEGSGSNVFAVSGGRLLTPPPDSGCLQGVTRGLLMECGLAMEEVLPEEGLGKVEEMFLTSSTRGVQAVGRLDGRRLPVVNGRWTQEARHALQKALLHA